MSSKYDLLARAIVWAMAQPGPTMPVYQPRTDYGRGWPPPYEPKDPYRNIVLRRKAKEPVP